MTIDVAELYDHLAQLQNLLDIKRRRLDEDLTPTSRRRLTQQVEALSVRVDEVTDLCRNLGRDSSASL